MTIINQLQSIYPSLILSKPDNVDHPFDYEWFQTPELDTIGIKKEEFSNRDSQLLSLFLTPYPIHLPSENEREKSWMDLLRGKSSKLSVELPLDYRFVFFSISEEPANKDTFQEALQSLFPRKMPLFWETDRSGFIIEEIMTEDQDIISFNEIIDVLMSDFYTKIRFYISEFSRQVTEAPEIFSWASHCHSVADRYRVSSVATYKDTLSYLYIDALPPSHWKHLYRSIFREVQDDEDLLHTIKVFLETGANASLTAKQLYMHRNSLQYRVDKFIEKTGIDVKQFAYAVPTYLALLMLDYE
ncbi:PucR family transcriptional regulator [Halobacillus mangrovi]|uniref:PucR C-terminal helix-turn-helix domain-containing protein n=1 Tax=Halobacillus mangrovi TaxID=402384 RepID=A0A1W5ZY09_9BACI|nr:helix-turn-helix domain-containing protein [Halobacillus mangrovi]ARI78127.1 hypothetical protein HM131_15265 [Halobacillus mangrovi]